MRRVPLLAASIAAVITASSWAQDVPPKPTPDATPRPVVEQVIHAPSAPVVSGAKLADDHAHDHEHVAPASAAVVDTSETSDTLQPGQSARPGKPPVRPTPSPEDLAIFALATIDLDKLPATGRFSKDKMVKPLVTYGDDPNAAQGILQSVMNRVGQMHASPILATRSRSLKWALDITQARLVDAIEKAGGDPTRAVDSVEVSSRPMAYTIMLAQGLEPDAVLPQPVDQASMPEPGPDLDLSAESRAAAKRLAQDYAILVAGGYRAEQGRSFRLSWNLSALLVLPDLTEEEAVAILSVSRKILSDSGVSADASYVFLESALHASALANPKPIKKKERNIPAAPLRTPTPIVIPTNPPPSGATPSPTPKGPVQLSPKRKGTPAPLMMPPKKGATPAPRRPKPAPTPAPTQAPASPTPAPTPGL